MASMDTVRLSRPLAALIGLLSGLVAVAAGHLVAGLIDPNASPYLAVGNTAIDLTPPAVKDFAVRTFGTYDKLVLLLGMVPVIVLFTVVAGLVSRRRPLPGMVLIGALGAVGILAVLRRPEVGQLAPLAPAASLVAGVLVFRWLHGLAAAHGTDGTDSTDSTDSAERRTRPTEPANTPVRDGGHAGGVGTAPRRGFLVATAATAIAAGGAGLAGQLLSKRVDVQASRRAVGTIRPAVAAPRIPAGADFAADGTPTFITPNPTFYRVDTALTVPRLRAEDWSLRVHGMVDRELTLRYDDLRDRELVEKTITLTCVSNEIGGPYVSTANFVGVPLREVLNEAGVRAGADQLASRSVDGWTCGTPTDVVMDPDRALLALAMNGEPLPTEHGFPVRMVVPGLYGYVSACKWITEIELSSFDDYDASWVPRGWAQQAPIKTQSRIDTPRGRANAGAVMVAGVAWAQHRGIERVEVQVDGGPWELARLADTVSADTWRQWSFRWEATPGTHQLAVRATDSTGETQPPDPAPPAPDGATGWHTIDVEVT
jgi:DMSO/TMAO reductase YedYZ molybdopterin-dependent catalytic subunit